MRSLPIINRRASVSLGPDGAALADPEGDLWPYTQVWWRLRRATNPAHVDPVNVVIATCTADAVIRALAAEGWSRPDDGGTHIVGFRGRRRMADHTALGTREERVHVRLFHVDGDVLAAAHHEVQDERGTHIVTSWDRARSVLVDALERAGYTPGPPSQVLVCTDVRGVPGDGRIWPLRAPEETGSGI